MLPSIFYGLPIYGYLTNTCFSINNIEKIQKYFTKRVYKRCPHQKIPHYIDRLKSIIISTLESQCVKTDLFTLFKMIGGLIDVPFKPVYSARNSSRIIYQPTKKSSLFRNSFFSSCPNAMEQMRFNACETDSPHLLIFCLIAWQNSFKAIFGSAQKAE